MRGGNVRGVRGSVMLQTLLVSNPDRYFGQEKNGTAIGMTLMMIKILIGDNQ